MSYKSKYGVTKIKSEKFNNLSLNWDSDRIEHNMRERRAVLLYTPDIDEMTHYHIELNLTQCRKFKKWLDAHIKAKEINKGN